MRIDRFFIQDSIGDQKTINVTDENVVHQWRKVLRYSPGVEMDLCDNSGFIYRGTLLSYDNGAEVEITDKKEGIVPKDFTLYMAVIKKDNFELVVQKATELGVTKIVPVLCDFSPKLNLNMGRLEKIMREASEQSERAVMPELVEVTTFEDVLNTAPENTVVLMARREGETKNTDAIFVGPEGGWSEKEIKAFEEKRIAKVSLGETVLRAETAAIAGISKLK